ncbi:MAG: class I SAM-dependent methyltransferase [Gammaproteobacteria bacterium]|nr:class I SAM-dependent methyltransferase [Gammaproteobacteria bacterium]
MSKKIDTKESGLLIGLSVFGFFVGAKDLHFGYWDDGLEVDIRNLAKAQEAYTEHLFSFIPDGVKTILDVGCGAGNIGRKLIERGYDVECVSPSDLLTQHAQTNLGENCHIYRGRYEDVVIDKKFDLVLFSESYQYIDMKTTFEKSFGLLNDKGHILICDFFKTEAPGDSGHGGGHSLREFYATLKSQPVTLIQDLDITDKTAPNIDIVRAMSDKLYRPIWDLVAYTFSHNRPWVAKVFIWFYKKKLNKIKQKHFESERDAKSFAIHKSYRLFLLKKS